MPHDGKYNPHKLSLKSYNSQRLDEFPVDMLIVLGGAVYVKLSK